MSSFNEDISNLLKYRELSMSDLVYFSDDNSFPFFMEKLINDLTKDLELAIKNEKIERDKNNIKADLDRFFNVFEANYYYKVIDKNLWYFFWYFSILLTNWFRMVKELKLEKIFELTDEYISEREKYAKNLTNLIDLKVGIRDTVNIVKRLINKAEEVLAASPKVFELSKHFVDAINEAEEVD